MTPNDRGLPSLKWYSYKQFTSLQSLFWMQYQVSESGAKESSSKTVCLKTKMMMVSPLLDQFLSLFTSFYTSLRNFEDFQAYYNLLTHFKYCINFWCYASDRMGYNIIMRRLPMYRTNFTNCVKLNFINDDIKRNRDSLLYD